MKFIAIKTSNGSITGKISLYCQVLKVSRQGFYNYLGNQDKPWKYEALAAKMYEIIEEDDCNDTYGRHRMYAALKLKRDAESDDFPHIPHERTVYRIMEKLDMVHAPKRKPNGITKADKEAMKADDKIKRDFSADEPLVKTVTDITEINTADGKLYISVIEDCFDNAVLGLSMADNMRAELCVDTLESAITFYPDLEGAIIHSDRGGQYTSEAYREAIKKYNIIQSMNSAAGRCHDNAKCESLWGRFKEELLYGRYETNKMPMAYVRSLIWRYFMSYWNNRRICSANGGLPPMVKRKSYYAKLKKIVA
jgi:transposase InsO family protein